MQNSVLTSEEIKEIIDRLYSTIGIRMNVNLNKYPNVNILLPINQSSFLDDCKVITDHLELPILVKPIFSSSFESKGVVLNEDNGTSGIGAQIHIPGNLPWYNTEAMNNYPINITVTPEALAQGFFFLTTQLSHEFSHIYLHSRRDPQKESEWATDLCALMMGFTPLWLQGRKQTRREVSSNHTTTYVQTQGYLSDYEFSFAEKYINNLRSPFEQLRNNISSIKQKIQLDCNEISKYIKDVLLLYDFHFKHPQKTFKHIGDAATFSKLAQSQYISDVEALLAKSKSATNVIVKPLQDKRVFYEKDKKWMENNLEELKAVEERLGQSLKELKHDYEVMIQNIDVEQYTSLFKTRVKSLSKGIREANKKILLINQKIEILRKSLEYYRKYKKISYAKETDTKTLSLISNGDFIPRSATFIKKEQEVVDGIERVLKEAHYFYSFDDDILVSKIAELNDVISTLEHCLQEQKNHIKIVIRNLTFIGKTKWFLKFFFPLHSDG